MEKAGKEQSLPDLSSSLKLFRDLSPATLQARKCLTPLTSILRQQAILYRWCFPTNVLINRKGTLHAATLLEEGKSLLSKWCILMEEDLQQTKNTSPAKVAKEWHTTPAPLIFSPVPGSFVLLSPLPRAEEMVEPPLNYSMLWVWLILHRGLLLDNFLFSFL